MLLTTGTGRQLGTSLLNECVVSLLFQHDLCKLDFTMAQPLTLLVELRSLDLDLLSFLGHGLLLAKKLFFVAKVVAVRMVVAERAEVIWLLTNSSLSSVGQILNGCHRTVVCSAKVLRVEDSGR